MNLRQDLIWLIIHRQSELTEEQLLDAMLDLLTEHDRRQRQMEWPFSFAEYLRLMRGEEYPYPSPMKREDR